MTNREKIRYLNQIIASNNKANYTRPKILYKYRPFDKYSFDMLENNYIYLCPAENEDDETECMTTIDIERLIDLETNNLKRECVNQIIEMIKPYTSEENFEIIKNKILAITRKNGTVRANFMLDLSYELREMLPEGLDIAQFVNWISNISEKLDEFENSEQLKLLFMLAYNARKVTGICSMAEDNNIQYMWEKYAADYSGYCIEYEIDEYEENKKILPVIYQDERETNIVIQLIKSFIGRTITDYSNGQIQADSSQFTRLFLTKYKKWEYQKEWRYLGYAGAKPIAPKIRCIYLGKNIAIENELKIRKYAKERSINIVKL